MLMLLGIAAMFAVPYHTLFHPTSAVLFGTGYGLAYPVITLPSRLVQAVTRGDAFCSALAQRKITTTCRPASPSASPTWSASTAAVARAPETTRRKRQRRQQPRRNVE
ncbi:hypothetical protein FSB65_02190 [Paraburkholderia sp. JPY418]|nr:hypothetical protein [Paraburkholderia youngii]